MGSLVGQLGRAGERALRLLENLCAAVATVLFVFLAASTFWMVLARRIGMRGAWVLEVGEYLLVALVFLPAAWVMRNEGHVTLDMLYEAVGPRVKRAFAFVGGLLSMVVVGLIAYYAIDVLLDLNARNIVLRKLLSVPKAWVIAPIAIGSTLLALRITVITLSVMRDKSPHITAVTEAEPPASMGG